MTTKAKKPSAFMKPVGVSDELAAIVGKGPMPRTEVTKKLWEYIKKHDLQSKTNRRNIEPDEKLAKVFGGKEATDMFKMNAKVNKHIKDDVAAK
ncbi:MAG: SWIB/MDM2 domain-containing protein [Chlamydiales bacterium]|nr:SWIB/MDM2 domain-containing protein [Chlamydiales bacterium]